MVSAQPRCGYTLPVFACAGAIAALHQLIHHASVPTVAFNLLNPDETVEIEIEQVAPLSKNSALAITRSDPGDNLDLTRHTPIWSIVSWAEACQTEQILLEGGEGIGHHTDGDAIYAYARQLIVTHLSAQLTDTQKIKVTIVLPEGRRLALRTSNAAFGVVDGLSLLGTSGIAQPLSAPDQLTVYRETLRQKAADYLDLVFCLGENGLDLATQHGIDADRRLKTANWLGPLLVEAGELGVRSILLFGYHGKLVKLAGGIFHTHHHVADARQEIMAACCVQAGLETTVAQQVLASATTEAALEILKSLDRSSGENWVEQVYGVIAKRIDQRSHAYIKTHTEQSVQVGSILFDRQRQIVVKSEIGQILLAN
ncbi:cobalt-precorrin-5B (C(1))-methyltransferase CbiD [cf. Phormidesmis sp. LEGE 11477]|uniref:cobalt-precorrin-5B (C(1))-methyltransferase CbiD n=1 Tax=cf. Phormidesmis sp. LEGE 11477 TaxID=1828680 RepID=UPI00187FDD20|nr:cobalt-precorrin-5B (C(1))-methyltransferase CbiD [cf. Phormidesmis sp. LEGE 11477]MBE9059382.1 cobalt-precorrin-5B (C(1))-methyltransferase [cf. Phormidesmis sp. LEGE 11477]